MNGFGKNEKFAKERVDIVNKLNTILGFKNGVNSLEIEVLNSKTPDIINIIDDIKKVFNYSVWSYFRYDQDVISLIKSIYNEMALHWKEKIYK